MSKTDSRRRLRERKLRRARARTILIGFGLLMLVLLAGFFGLRNSRLNEGERVIDRGTNEQLNLTRDALASTENLDATRAIQEWDTIFQQSPNDASVALNRAINRVLVVDALVSEVNNPALDSEAVRAVRSKLPAAISAARSAINDFSSVASERITPMWLLTRVNMHEATLLPRSMSKSLRREIAERLSKAITSELGKEPRAILLGGSLIEVLTQMEDPIDGLADDVLKMAATTIAELSDLHSDNLFFALRAAQLNIQLKNTTASAYVLRTGELTKAISPSLARETRAIGLTPDEMIAQITNAVDSQDWSKAETRMAQWFNLLNGTELVKTDRRRASPHPLDRLNFDGLRRLSAAAAASSPLSVGKKNFRLKPYPIEGGTSISILQTVDFDLDLDLDLVSVNDAGLLQLWQNDGEGRWSNAGEVNLDMHPSGVIVADLFLVDSSSPQRLRSDQSSTIRHNTFLNLVAYGQAGVRLVRIDGGTRSGEETTKRLKVVTDDSGLDAIRGVTAAVAGDLEADGDLDLVFATQADGVRMFVNRGNRTFFEIEGHQDRFGGDDPVSSMAIADLDRDLDLDIVTTHAGSGQVGLLENLLHLQFRARKFDEIPAIAGAASIAVEEIDGNVSWDLVVGGIDRSAIIFSQTADAGAWSVDRIETSEGKHDATAMVVADLDNDSWMDAAAIGESISVSRLGPWGWKDWNAVEMATNNSAALDQDIESVVTGDFDGNGSIDLAGIVGGQVMVLTNPSDDVGHYLDVRFKGIDDNASGRVNHFAIGSVLELRFGPHYRSQIVTSPSTHFGLDGRGESVTVRAILPNGLTQTIRDPVMDTLVEEEQTLKGSCPYLYAWNGTNYEFVTDCLWAAPLG
jgi:hypothetical protein